MILDNKDKDGNSYKFESEEDNDLEEDYEEED